MKKRMWWIGGIALGVAAVTTVAVVVGASASAPSEPAAPKTTTATVERADVTAAITGKGTLAPLSTANVSFPSGGTVTGISVTLGQTVSAGQDLATIDPAAADRELEKVRSAASAADQAIGTARANAARARETLEATRNALRIAQLPPAPVPTPTEGAPPVEQPSAEDRAAKIAAAQQAVRDAEAAVANADTEIAGAKRTRADAGRDVAAAESVRAQTTLKAPIGGVITAINGTIGSIASGGGTSQESGGQTQAAGGGAGFIQISDTSGWTITVAVSEIDITKVVVGQAARISMPGAQNEEIAGAVTIVAPTPSASTDGVVSYAVTVKLNEPPKNPKLGLTSFVSIVVGEAKGVPTVPSEAITPTGDGAGTVRLRSAKGTTKSVEVTTGIVGDGRTEIRSGLKPGDKVEMDIPAAPPMEPGADEGEDMSFGMGAR